MNTTTSNKPHQLTKVGRVRVKIWQKTDENGNHEFDVELFRTYKLNQDKLEDPEDKGFRDVHVFSKSDLLHARYQIDRTLELVEKLENE